MKIVTQASNEKNSDHEQFERLFSSIVGAVPRGLRKELCGELATDRLTKSREQFRERLARETNRRAPRVQAFVGACAMGAVVTALAIAGGWLFRHRGGLSNPALEVVVSEGTAAQLDRGNRAEFTEKVKVRILASGELETAPDSKANIRAADGLQIELGGQTRVALERLQAKSRQLRLLRGVIRCAVPHDSASQPFQVLTPDVTIIDLGTVFTVSLEGPTRPTRVTVLEGEVMVRHASGETRVRAPGSWSSPMTAFEAPETAASSETAPIASGAASSPGGRPSPRPPRSDVTLEEEAQLLRQGLAAERLGHLVEASSVLSLLLRKYPSSSLAPDARAALQRVEARAHP
jgi:ferric-dicitrate binding protein FerR (iron transport regulator)